MKKTSPPALLRFCITILEILKDSGGSATPSEVIDLVVDKLNIPEREVEKKSKAGYSYIKHQIYWARFRLLKLGYVDFSRKGVWSLTEKGLEATLDENDAEKVEDIDHKTELLGVLKALPSDGFDRICQRLLREAGFQQVVVTRKNPDGEIEGHGLLQVNPFLSFYVRFECKRGDGAITLSHIRDFRGTMMGRADKGIIITTGSFTAEARNEARRFGVPPIEIIDGEKLVEIFEQLELGLKTKQIYLIDQKFFEDFRH